MKKLVLAIIPMLMLSLAACSTWKPAQDADNPPPESLAMLDAGVWPENEYTAGLAVPPGTVSWAALDTTGGHCTVFLTGLTEEEYNTYMERLKKDGFSVTEEVSEEIQGQNYTSIGTVLSDGERMLSVSYIPDQMGIYISLPGEP